MRFCTSGRKTSQIHSALKRRFKGLPIISVAGVRRAESRQRARASIADQDKSTGTWTWRPILGWSTSDVFTALDDWGIRNGNLRPDRDHAQADDRPAESISGRCGPSRAPVRSPHFLTDEFDRPPDDRGRLLP